MTSFAQADPAIGGCVVSSSALRKIADDQSARPILCLAASFRSDVFPLG